VLHWALTAAVPFPRDGDEAKLWSHLSDPPPAPSAVSPGLGAFDAVVATAMAKDPADRYATAGDLGRAARAALTGEAPTRSAVRPATVRPRAVPWRAVLAVVAALAIVAVVAVVAIPGDDEAPRSRPAARTPVAPAPAAAPEPVATIRHVLHRPDGLAVAAGAAWVTSSFRPGMVRIDLETNERTAGPRVGRGVLGIVADGRSLWMPVAKEGVVRRVDAGSGRVTATVTTPGTPTAVAVDRRGPWVAVRDDTPSGPYQLIHYDRRSLDELQRIEVAAGVRSLAVGGGRIWVIARFSSTLYEISPAAGKVVRRVRVGGGASRVAYGAGAVWTTNASDNTITRIDPRTLRATGLPASDRPRGIAVRDGRVWVAAFGAHELDLIDPGASRAVGEPVPTGLNPYAIGVTPTDVWVTNVGDDSVTRIAITGRAR
jgi:streptogramin lyase